MRLDESAPANTKHSRDHRSHQSVCGLLKRDNKALAMEVIRLRKRREKTATVTVIPAIAAPQPDSTDEIRQYVAQRAKAWASLKIDQPDFER